MANDEDIDEALRETFPASDPPANTVEARIGAAATPPDVHDRRDANRFEVTVGGHTAFLAYQRSPHSLTLIHTEVPDQLRGHHVGEQLVAAALDTARREHLSVVAVCPFVKAYLRRHPEPA